MPVFLEPFRKFASRHLPSFDGKARRSIYFKKEHWTSRCPNAATTSLRWCVSRWSLTRRARKCIFARVSSSPWHHWLPLPLDEAPVTQGRWPVAAGVAVGRAVEQMQCCSHGDSGCWELLRTLCRQSLNGDDIIQRVGRKTTSLVAAGPVYLRGDSTKCCFCEI